MGLYSQNMFMTLDSDQYLELLMEIESLCNQVENFIRVTVGPKYPKNAFKVAVSLTTKVSQIGPRWVAEILGAGKQHQSGSPWGLKIQRF